MRPWMPVIVIGFTLANGAWGQHTTPPSPAASAPEKVEFESAPRPLGRLQERRARERGEDPKPTPGDRLEGYLIKPEGNGPFPAVVVMPGCSGLTADLRETLPRTLASWGYVTLVVDSHTTRKVELSCLKDSASVDRVADAYGGLFHLAGLPFVDRSRIGVLGVAIGGRVALVLAEPQSDAAVHNPGKLAFKAGVAYYPSCTVSKESPTFPLLIMIGRNDQSTNAWTCEQLVSARSGNTVPTELTVYPDAHHGFLEREWSTAREIFGARYEYNETAAENALQRTRDFLARYVKG